jgi:hypothetical protein
MQYIKLNLDSDDFFCPATGAPITTEEAYEASPAQVGMWHCEVLEEPEIHSDELETAWTNYMQNLDEEDYFEMEEFLASLDLKNHVCFEITTRGIACGPVITTVWFVIDLGHETAEPTLFSPITGKCADADEADETVIFSYIGDAGEFGYISPNILKYMPDFTEECQVEKVVTKLKDREGMVILQQDCGFNGINTYGFIA